MFWYGMNIFCRQGIKNNKYYQNINFELYRSDLVWQDCTARLMYILYHQVIIDNINTEPFAEECFNASGLCRFVGRFDVLIASVKITFNFLYCILLLILLTVFFCLQTGLSYFLLYQQGIFFKLTFFQMRPILCRWKVSVCSQSVWVGCQTQHSLQPRIHRI